MVAQPQIRPGHRLLEICLDSVESAVNAERGGADRIELCASLPEGGTTPSAGMIAAVRKQIKIGLQIMIRPRGGDFCYSADEFGIMQRDILIARQLGANGVVFGLLDLEGNIDRPRMQQLIDRALNDLIELRVDRVLTSGGQKSAIDAMPTLKQITQHAGSRISVMVCGEVSITNVKAVVNYTGAPEVHAGLGEAVASAMRFRNSRIAMGSLAGAEYQRTVVSEHSVRELRAALDSI